MFDMVGESVVLGDLELPLLRAGTKRTPLVRHSAGEGAGSGFGALRGLGPLLSGGTAPGEMRIADALSPASARR